MHVVADPSAAVWLVEPIARRQAAQGYQVEFVSEPGEYLHKLYELNYPITVVPISRRLASCLIYKFRTMVAKAEDLRGTLLEKNEMKGPAFKIRNDPRITNDFNRWARLDMEYIENWSSILDLELLLRTVQVVLRGTGI